ncbi:MAG TPA: EVE domain-containing protein [Spirochaetia bacterium]|nr:EVE domain-containing protein [Spirochaetia bacterium]
MSSYWVIVASKDHASLGIRGSFIQANHGKRTALDRMKRGDRVVIYSPKEVFGGPGALRSFTALATVIDDETWQADMSRDFKPFRRKAQYEPTSDAPLLPLLDRLSFIRNKQAYGAVFRFGVVKIPESDFHVIRAAMTQPE